VANQNPTREEDLVNKLKTRFPEAIKSSKIEGKHRITIPFDKDKLLDIAEFMRDELGFDHVKGVAGVDDPTHKKIEILYFTASLSKPEIEDIILVLQTQLARDNPTIASAVSVWESAHFHESETVESMRKQFDGHPDHRKLLTLDNWDGPPPMLKDIKFPEMGQR